MLTPDGSGINMCCIIATCAVSAWIITLIFWLYKEEDENDLE